MLGHLSERSCLFQAISCSKNALFTPVYFQSQNTFCTSRFSTQRSGVTQGALHSHRDGTVLNNLKDSYNYDNNGNGKNDCKFVIPPTIQTKNRPIPESLEYSHVDKSSSSPKNDTNGKYKNGFDTIRQTNQQFSNQNGSNFSANYSADIDASRMVGNKQNSKNNRNPHSKLYNSGNNGNQDDSSDKLRNVLHNLRHIQPTKRDNLINNRLKQSVSVDSSDLFDKNGKMSFKEAQNAQKQVEYDSYMLDEKIVSNKIGSIPESLDDIEDINNSIDDLQDELYNEELNVVNNNNSGINETPDFVSQYPDPVEREAAIDEYLGKAPSRCKDAPPDAILLPMYASASDYSKMLNIAVPVIEAQLNDLGIYISNVITQEAGQLLVEALRPDTQVICEAWIEDVKPRLPYSKEEASKLRTRNPVVCILGHVDHGKTTLLDYLRNTHIAENEAGGITQSIGAFPVEMPKGSRFEEIVMFDTPGHAAFSGMRQRGAHVVDVAILIVAATDGVQPQTRESLAIIRKEKIPFIVAINKIDRPEANLAQIYNELEDLGILKYENEIIEISAKTGQNVSQLLETIDIVCELEDPRGDSEALAEMVVFEAKKSSKEGTVVNALVQDGTLRNGDIIMQDSGFDYCKVSRLKDFKQNDLSNGQLAKLGAGPSTAVTFLGFKEDTIPAIGSRLYGVKDLKTAREIIEAREKHEYFDNKIKESIKMAGNRGKILYNARAGLNQHNNNGGKNSNISEQYNYSKVLNDSEDKLMTDSKWVTVDDPRCLNVWIRGDSLGSIDAIENFLFQIEIPNNEYFFNVVNRGIGMLAFESLREADEANCFVLAFNVDTKAVKNQLKSLKHLKVFDDNVIFHLFEKYIQHLENKLRPNETHRLCGRAVVKEIFNVKSKEKQTLLEMSRNNKDDELADMYDELHNDISEEERQKIRRMKASERKKIYVKKRQEKAKANAMAKKEVSVIVTNKIAGLVVESGKILTNGHFKVLRFGKVMYEQLGASELRHFAMNVSEVEQGDECGLKLEYNDWDHDDVIECYAVDFSKKKIESPLFELDPQLQNSLYNNNDASAASAASATSTNVDQKNDDVLNSIRNYNLNEELFGDTANKGDDSYQFTRPQESNASAPKVRVHKQGKKVTFEQVDFM